MYTVAAYCSDFGISLQGNALQHFQDSTFYWINLCACENRWREQKLDNEHRAQKG
jgi:hypothetical protein